jgi:energy-coupling factor transporter ATP-binding protein EcfA2
MDHVPVETAQIRPAGAAIAVENLTKRYGDVTAVDDLSFTVRPGAVTGFLGPNGAGKTTALKVIVGLARPSAGRALISGTPIDAGTPDARERDLLPIRRVWTAGAVLGSSRGGSRLIMLVVDVPRAPSCVAQVDPEAWHGGWLALRTRLSGRRRAELDVSVRISWCWALWYAEPNCLRRATDFARNERHMRCDRIKHSDA